VIVAMISSMNTGTRTLMPSAANGFPK
jgi:hypothetical protein